MQACLVAILVSVAYAAPAEALPKPRVWDMQKGPNYDSKKVAKIGSSPTKGSNTCANPGDGQTRVWYGCTGAEFPAPTEQEQALGITVGSNMCCTEEVNFECLCCMDFEKPLEFNRCGSMNLNAAQKSLGSPGAMEDDTPKDKVGKNTSMVLICSEERSMSQFAGKSAVGSTVSTPVECIRREFRPEELSGSSIDAATGRKLKPGQIIFDERIQFLVAQGLPAGAIPTCKETVPGTCPIGTPKAGKKPNSAGQETLAKLKGGGLSEEKQAKLVKQDAKFRARGGKGGGGGFLSTSGSFTLSGGGGAQSGPV